MLQLMKRTSPGVGSEKAAQGTLPHVDDVRSDSAPLDEAKRCKDHRLIIFGQQLLECFPYQLNRLRGTSCGWCQGILLVQSVGRRGCQDTMHFIVSTGSHMDKPGQPSVPHTSHSRAFVMAWLMSSKMLLRGILGPDSRFHALTNTARSLPSRDLSCSSFMICIAQRSVCCCASADFG